jgi:hypothetical protein
MPYESDFQAHWRRRRHALAVRQMTILYNYSRARSSLVVARSKDAVCQGPRNHGLRAAAAAVPELNLGQNIALRADF